MAVATAAASSLANTETGKKAIQKGQETLNDIRGRFSDAAHGIQRDYDPDQDYGGETYDGEMDAPDQTGEASEPAPESEAPKPKKPKKPRGGDKGPGGTA